MGYGPNNEIADIVSGHANFNAYAVLFIVLLHLLEGTQLFPAAVLHVMGAAFIIGRFLHFKAFSSKTMNFNQRVVGMHLTIWPLMICAVLSLVASFLSA